MLEGLRSGPPRRTRRQRGTRHSGPSSHGPERPRSPAQPLRSPLGWHCTYSSATHTAYLSRRARRCASTQFLHDACDEVARIVDGYNGPGQALTVSRRDLPFDVSRSRPSALARECVKTVHPGKPPPNSTTAHAKRSTGKPQPSACVSRSPMNHVLERPLESAGRDDGASGARLGAQSDRKSCPRGRCDHKVTDTRVLTVAHGRCRVAAESHFHTFAVRSTVAGHSPFPYLAILHERYRPSITVNPACASVGHEFPPALQPPRKEVRNFGDSHQFLLSFP